MLTDIFNLCYDLLLERSYPIFYWTFRLMMVYQETSFAYKRISLSENIAETNIIFIWAPTATSTFAPANRSSALNYGSWWCIYIPSLVTNGSVVHKI